MQGVVSNDRCIWGRNEKIRTDGMSSRWYPFLQFGSQVQPKRKVIIIIIVLNVAVDDAMVLQVGEIKIL